MSFVGIDVAQTRISLHLEKSLRKLSSSRLANRRIHAYHSVIAMSLLHPALLMLTLFIVLRIQSRSLRFKQCYHSYSSKATGGPKDKTTKPPLTFRETTVLMCVYVEKGEMYLQVIIHQRLVMSGDVELNPGPLGVLDLRSVTNELGSVMAKWFSIGVQLGVDEGRLHEIETNYRTTDRCFSEVISFWLKGNTQVAVSWKSLVEVLESPFVNENGLARRLREKGGLGEHVKVPEAAESGVRLDEVQTQETNGGGRGKKKSVEDDNRDEEHEHREAEARSFRIIETPRLTFPMLDQIVEISGEEKEHLKQRLYNESVDMIYKFQELFSATIKSLKERKIKVTELLNHIGCLGAIEPVYVDSKLGHLRCELPKAETIDDVMSLVREYSSFFNYRMLENIINHLGGEQDRRNLANYLQDFAEYAKRKVYECPCEVGTINEYGRSNMFVTLDKSYDDCTVSSLKSFEKELGKILKVSSDVVVILCRIAPGSLQLMFQIPLLVQKAIFPLSSEQEIALSKLGVVNLSCGDYLFTDNSETKGTEEDHSSEEGDSDTEEQSTAAVAGTDLLSVMGGLDILAEKGSGRKGGSSFADSALGTSLRHSVTVSGATFTGLSQFSEDIMLRDLQDEPYLRMEAKLGPPDDSSGLELHQAAGRGELDRVKQLIEEKELNPLQVDKNGNNALHYTAAGGHLPVMKYFIEEQCLNPACQGWKSQTPLHLAAECKHLDLVKFLIGEHHMDPLCQDEYGWTPLHSACAGGDIDVIQYLISEMKKHTSLDSIVYDRTKDGYTAVHIAALEGHLPVVKLFISGLKFDPNTPGFKGRPPLVNAAQGGHLNVVQYFIEELHCDPSYAPGEDRATPLHMAAQWGHLDVIRYLTLNRKCSPLIRNSHGNTPLHEAAGNGQYEAVKFFISELNCDPNTPGLLGGTSIHLASQEGHLNIVQYFIDIKKCNPASLDNRKVNPLHLASGKGQLHIVKYLIEEKHCNPLCYDKALGTPLHWAAKDGQIEIVKYLVEACKCPVNIRGAYRNMTPLELARAQGHTNVVQYLSSQV